LPKSPVSPPSPSYRESILGRDTEALTKEREKAKANYNTGKLPTLKALQRADKIKGVGSSAEDVDGNLKRRVWKAEVSGIVAGGNESATTSSKIFVDFKKGEVADLKTREKEISEEMGEEEKGEEEEEEEEKQWFEPAPSVGERIISESPEPALPLNKNIWALMEEAEEAAAVSKRNRTSKAETDYFASLSPGLKAVAWALPPRSPVRSPERSPPQSPDTVRDTAKNIDEKEADAAEEEDEEQAKMAVEEGLRGFGKNLGEKAGGFLQSVRGFDLSSKFKF